MNLLRALATVSGMTLLSRILGFVRDFVIARAFGAGLATDVFFVAFKLPNLLRRMFAEGAFSQAFVPILGEYRNKRSEDDTRTLIDHVASLLSLVLFAVTAIGIAAAPVLVWISAPGFAAETGKFELTVTLTRITFPYIFFMSLVALSGEFSIAGADSRFPRLRLCCSILLLSAWPCLPHLILNRPYWSLPGLSLLVDCCNSPYRFRP
jgi:putative peptidoglycan lipid II flippase